MGAPCTAHLFVGLFLESNVLLGKGESCVTSILKQMAKPGEVGFVWALSWAALEA